MANLSSEASRFRIVLLIYIPKNIKKIIATCNSSSVAAFMYLIELVRVTRVSHKAVMIAVHQESTEGAVCVHTKH